MNAPRLKRTESGVALVVTLILLAMIAFMAIAFLVLTRGERSSVTTVADQTVAKLASDTGLERSKIELLAPMMAFRDPHRYDLMVSTNYVNPLGFDPSLPDQRLTNVSYVYKNGNPLSLDDHARNLLNLYYYPRVPVYVNVNNSNDFRYYLDLNRNGRYDTNGLLAVMSGDSALPYFDTNGARIAQPFVGRTASNFFVGDPEWIGQLERPGYPHSPSNRFVARYAYIAIPAGKTLDINTVHNYAKPGAPENMQFDHFLRNQGVGPWEINLAGLFADLNTNRWPYPETTVATSYNYIVTNSAGNMEITLQNSGSAFETALSILQYRYRGSYSLVNMRSVQDLFGMPGANAFRFDYVDGYSTGPLMTNTWWPSRPNDADQARLARPWAGDQSPRTIFNHQELFNFPLIAERLRIAGSTNSSYDRYTFYRMLAQLGTDSSTDNSDQMNLNYDNLVTRNRQGRTSATNFVSWSSVDGHTGLAFFTNAAMRLFASSGYNFNITNIQIYPTNYYTPSVHRLLQLAANMYDATTTRYSGTNQLPTVFRPVLDYGVGGGDNVYITGFAPVTDATFIINNFDRLKDLTLPEDRRTIGPNDLAYGVPLVIGAKKGLPNFNEFAGQTAVQVTRKLEFRRNTASGKVVQTNQMYVVAITNTFGLEAWNSYSNLYPRSLRLLVQGEVYGAMTNDAGAKVLDNVHRTAVLDTNFPARSWPGFVDINSASYSFRVPIDPATNSVFLLTNSTYLNSTRVLRPLTGIFERGSGFPDLKLYLNLRTRFKFALIDQQTSRLIDYVTIDSVEDTLDIARIISEDSVYPKAANAKYVPDATPGSLWATNRSKNDIQTPNFGVLNQVVAGMGAVTINEAQWRNFVPKVTDAKARDAAQERFRNAMLRADTQGAQVFYSPFDPIRTIYYNTVWQANDPLVHYTIGDLMLPRTNRYELDVTLNSPINNIRAVNPRYEPWTLQTASQSSSPTRFDWGVKDPLITRSDDWDFPTNKFPNAGWLGRVHRGTPWQTVYLKSPPTDLKKWQEWSRNLLDPVNYGQLDTNRWAYNARYNDAELSRPDRDWELFDLFTTSFSESASRGKMSINQTNLAAWSAMLSGVLVMTNAVTDAQLTDEPLLRPTNTWMAVQPAGIYDQTLAYTNWPQVAQIVRGINATRATTNFQGSFKHLGDILAVPQLTVESPFLNKASLQKTRALDDAAVERIPQQILGLLKVESAPRFVIYSYGQSLKPANNGVMVSGPYFNLCTNYQVTAEVATKAVVRVEGVPNKPRVIVESYNPLPPD